MSCKRIVSKFEIKGPNLVKGIKLEGLRVLGKPDDFSELYYKEGIDEIYYQDCVASLYGRNSLYDIIEKVSRKIFIPLCVGGGIKNLEDIYKILKIGADKISINKAAIKKPNFLYSANKKFGKANICISIEAVKIKNDYYCYFDNGRNYSGLKVLDWIKKINKIGAGEINITFVDFDGTGKGFDLLFIKKITRLTNIPIVISGGAGDAIQVSSVLKLNGISGIAIGSMFHYYYYAKLLKKNYLLKFKDEGNFEYISCQKNNNLVRKIKIKKLKAILANSKIKCRI